MDGAFQTLAHLVELRRVRSSLSDGEPNRRLGAVTAQLRRDVGVGVPKRRAAKLLGVSVQALDRWVANGVLPVVRVPDSSRRLIDAEALLVLAEEVALRREQGERRGVVAAALHHLADEGRLPRSSARTSPRRSSATSICTRLRPSGFAREWSSASSPGVWQRVRWERADAARHAGAGHTAALLRVPADALRP